MWLRLLVVLLVQRCSAFKLSDVEHDRLPQLFSLDNYHKCMRYNGTYCMLRLDLFAEEGNELMQLIRDYSQHHHVKHFNYTYLERGVCVSASCQQFVGTRGLTDPNQLHQVVQECSNDSVWREYGLFANVTSELCEHASQPLQVDSLDWAVLAGFLAILAINVAGTLYDYLVDKDKDSSKGRRMLRCFSLIRNTKYLVSSGSDDSKNRLKGINAFRNAGSFGVVIGHAAFLLLGGFIDNQHDVEKSAYKLHYEITWYGSYIVQIFFVIASLLLVYNLEKASETHPITFKSIPKLMLLRFWRLAPPLAVMLAFCSTWLRHLSSGALWSRNILNVVTDCRRYWWTHLLFINNYVLENRNCALHTWHLAADTQLFFMGLLVYILIKKLASRSRNLVLGLLLLLGIVIPAYQVWKRNLDLIFFISPQMSRHVYDENFKYIHKPAHMNIAGYVIGMYAGYKMYEWEKKEITFKSKKVVTLIRVAVVVFMVSLAHIIRLLNTDDISLGVRMVYQASIRTVVGSAVAVALLTMTGKPGTDYSIFYWNIWNFLGRTSYSVFLSHMSILNILFGIRTQLYNFHFLSLLETQLGFYLLSVIVGIPFYLMVEAPLTPLLKFLMTSSTTKNRLQKNSGHLENIQEDVCTHKEDDNKEETEPENDTKKTI